MAEREKDPDEMTAQELDDAFWTTYITDPAFREMTHQYLAEIYPEAAKEMREKGGITVNTFRKITGASNEEVAERALLSAMITHLAKAWDAHVQTGKPLPPAFTTSPAEIRRVMDLTRRADQGDLTAITELKRTCPGVFDDIYDFMMSRAGN